MHKIIATVIKLVQEVIPPEVVVSKESLNLLIECCIGKLSFFPYLFLTYLKEFIHLISSESNEICEKDAKKTIVPEHVVSALKVSAFWALILAYLYFFVVSEPWI